jgi:fatty-acyl-CoA synthase
MADVWSEAPRRGVVARAQVTSIADVRAIERTPFLELLPSWTILGMIEHAAAETPGKTAIIVLDKDEPTRAGRGLTYAELAVTIRATANRLREVSGNRRPVVSILTPLLAESFIASWAGATAGLANPINPFLRVEHVANIMNAAGTTVLVCGTAFDGPGAWNEVGTLRAMVPTLREVWCVDHVPGNDFFRQQIGTAACERLAFERGPGSNRGAASHRRHHRSP